MDEASGIVLISAKADTRRMLRFLPLFACLWLAAGSASAADGSREVHGSADAFAEAGVALAWAVARGGDEASTAVVVRIVADPALYRFVVVAGRDPFTQRTEPVLRVTPNDRRIDARVARSHFSEFPRTEFRFYVSDATLNAGTPALVVYFLGVPDTTPEFADAARLDAYLDERIARLRANPGSKTP